MAFIGFDNLGFWWPFLSLIPFFLIYLIKPKPKELHVPSLMFFTKSLFAEKERSFLRKITRDWIFFLQLLALLSLCLYFIEPYINAREGVFLDNVVIILDTSASMNVDNVFDEALEKTRDLLGGKTTLILVSNSPKIALENADKKEAKQFLKSLRATSSRSNIGDAILLGGEVAEGEKPVVYVISDFLGTEGTEIDIAKNALQTKGISIEFIDVKTERRKDNIGIIDLRVDATSSQVFIKNYKDVMEDVELRVNDLSKTIPIGSGDTETFSFKTPAGITELEILNKDDFDVDNHAFISKPEGDLIKVLLVTNDESLYLKTALSVSKDISIKVSNPPIIDDGDYDIYIIHNVAKKSLITGNIEKIKEKVEQGKVAIIHAQKDSQNIDYKGILPTELGKLKGFAPLITEQTNKFTKDITFGNVKQYFATENTKGTTVVSGDNSTIISAGKYGAGKVAYYGVLEDASDFKLSPSYPLFWVNFIKYLSNTRDIHELNTFTGLILTLPIKQNIKTPTKIVSTEILTLDDIGIYTVGGQSFAVNLVSELESDLNQETSREDLIKTIRDVEEEGIKQDITTLALIIAICVLFIELLWTKLRGDI